MGAHAPVAPPWLRPCYTSWYQSASLYQLHVYQPFLNKKNEDIFNNLFFSSKNLFFHFLTNKLKYHIKPIHQISNFWSSRSSFIYINNIMILKNFLLTILKIVNLSFNDTDELESLNRNVLLKKIQFSKSDSNHLFLLEGKSDIDPNHLDLYFGRL